MNHLFDIFATLDQLPPNSEAVLATVVSVEGSAYRQPGARMLILADGQSIGDPRAFLGQSGGNVMSFKEVLYKLPFQLA